MFLAVVPDRLESFERLSFIVFRLVIFLSFCCTWAMLLCINEEKWYPHSHTHFVFVHIRHFYKKKKKMESSCLNKKEKILMFKVMLVLVVLFFSLTLHENLLKIKSNFLKHDWKDIYFAVVSDLHSTGNWIHLKTQRIPSGKCGMCILQDACDINIWDSTSSIFFPHKKVTSNIPKLSLTIQLFSVSLVCSLGQWT